MYRQDYANRAKLGVFSGAGETFATATGWSPTTARPGEPVTDNEMGRPPVGAATIEQHDTTPATEPGSLLRLTAAAIEDEGIPVRYDAYGLTLNPGPEPEGQPEGQAREADADRWSLMVDDNADVRLAFAPVAGRRSDPRRIAGIAAALLAGTPGAGGSGADSPAPVTGRDDPAAPPAGLKEAAGLLLRARGFLVELNAYVDDTTLSLGSDVSATAAGTRRWNPDVSGAVYITDDGGIDFACPFWDPDPATAARAIAATVTAAVRAAQPGTET
jgi:hypothetical protein